MKSWNNSSKYFKVLNKRAVGLLFFLEINLNYTLIVHYSKQKHLQAY